MTTNGLRNYSITIASTGADFGEFCGYDRADVIREFYLAAGYMDAADAAAQIGGGMTAERLIADLVVVDLDAVPS